MKRYIQNTVATVLVLLLLLIIAGCAEEKETALQSKPVSSVNAVKEEKESKPEESKSEISLPSELPSESPSSTVQKIGVEGMVLSADAFTLVQGTSDRPTVTMQPTTATNKGTRWSSNNNSIATVNSVGKISAVGVGSCTITVRSTDNPNVYANISVTVTAPKEPELTYINGILIANKTYALPSTYDPGVDPTANAALQIMFEAAKADGINLYVRSGYRNYATQKRLYDNYVKRDGVAGADRYSARPGHSEHQTGLAFDINRADSTFIGTAEANWLAANCYKYGFIVRYPSGKESITGYKYEPWHIRYLGVDIATAVYNSGLCLEEYLGITSVYQY